MDVKMIVAFVLIGLIILAMPLYQRYVLRRAAEQPVVESEVERERDREEEWEEEVGGTEEPIVEQEVAMAPVEEVAPPEEPVVSREVVVENELFRGVINTVGGTIRRWELKRFKKPDRLQDVELVGEGIVGGGVRVRDARGQYDLTGVSFATEVERVQLEGEEVGEVRLVAGLGSGRVEKVFRFWGNRYDFEMVVQVEGFEGEVDCGVGWEGGILPTESEGGEVAAEDIAYTKVYGYMGGERVEYKEKEPLSLEGRVGWACVRNKYFAVAMVPLEDGIARFRATGGMKEGLGQKRLDMWIDRGVERGGMCTSRMYIGPLKYNVVSALGVGLERVMDLGWWWIRPIGKVVVQVLVGLRRLIPNYGVVIMVFSVLVKAVLYPLTRKSRDATVKMQRLQPELAKLKEKYRGDREGLNRATLRLYKEHGANPAGGCLPMLLQMPILIALFTVFRHTIEFRQAGFISWWINDLSRPDPRFVLPVLMGVTMFIQQKMTMKDPKQAAMVYIMPAVMIFLFARFPSGLVLYYTMFNILSLVEQMVMVRRGGVGSSL